jgi:hypothetical protein
MKLSRSQIHASLRAQVAVATLAAVLAGCTTTEPAATERPTPVRMERITGAGGEHVGWIRTDQATPDGGTYEVIYDADWNEIGMTTTPGQHYRPDGAKLDYAGTYSRSQGVAELTGRRAVDISAAEVGHQELARSGPFSSRSSSTSVEIRGDRSDEGMTDEDMEETDDEE